MTRRPLLPVALVALCGLLAGCGASDAPAGAETVGDTLGGIGAPPPTGQGAGDLTLPATPGTFPGGEDIPVPAASIGETVLGNRVLLIGDSLFAGLATRYGGDACEGLVPLGWQVAVEAESGRFIDFANRVLDARLDEGWDAVVVMLGTNYGGDEVGYEAELSALLDRLAPRPVVLLTTTVFRETQVEVNEVIARQVLARDGVEALDWSTMSEEPGVLAGDGIHATDAGRAFMVQGIAALLGTAPVQPGDCLTSEFTDDSAVAGAPGGPGGQTTVAPVTTSGSNVTTSPSVAPTVAPTTAAPMTTVVTTAPTTAAPTTAAPTTVAPTTAAPTTAAPTTAAPTTAAPTTAAPTTAAPAPAP